MKLCIALAGLVIAATATADIYQYSDCDGNGTLLLTELDAEPGVDLSGLYLGCADLFYANLAYANLTGADLYYADLFYANLTNANLTAAGLFNANLTGANLTNANLTNVHLTGANLTGANLEGVNLYYANLYDADLTDADLSGADLSNANLSQVFYWETATWTHATYNAGTQFHPKMDPDSLGMRHVEQTIVVDANGGGSYSNIQDAIDSITDKWTGPTEILVMPGTYTDIHSQVIDPSGHALWIHGSGGADSTFITGEGERRVVFCRTQEGTDTIFEDLTFINGYSQHGAGMWTSNSQPQVINCVFDSNVSYGFGGGLYISATGAPTVEGCAFTNNTALDGGGVKNAGNNPTFTNCTFSGNTASDSGGGLNNYGATATYTNCTFANNEAGLFGGGVHNGYGSTPVFDACVFDSNTCVTGGGVRNDGESNASFIDCNIFDNTGEGVQNHNSSPSFVGCSIENNNGTGMLSLLASNPTLQDTTLCDNTPMNIDGPYTDLGGNTICEDEGCSSDVNGDGSVDVHDILQLVGAWGNLGGDEDINGDGVVGVADLLILIAAWGACP